MGLKEKRKTKGYSQSEVADILGMPLRTYKRYESTLNDGSYKYKMLVNTLDGLRNKTKAKILKRRNIAVIGSSDQAYVMSLMLSETNRVTMINNEFDNNGSKITNYHNEICKYKKSFKPSKIRTVAGKKHLNSADITIFFGSNRKEISDTQEIENVVGYLDSNNPNSIFIIRADVPFGFCEKVNNNYKHVEIVVSPVLNNGKPPVEDLLFPSSMLFGVYRKNVKNKTTVSIFDTIPLNNCKGIFVNYGEAEAMMMFNKEFEGIRTYLINSLNSFAAKNDLDVENIKKGLVLFHK